MNNYGIIVDGYSTGAGLAPELSQHGISCIHVQSQPEIPKVYSHTFVPRHYKANYLYNADMIYLTNELSKYNPKFVIPGAECGIELADKLCSNLGLPGNGIELSACRRDKYQMIKRVESQGIQTIPSFKTSSLTEALNWAEKESVWPLVVKPLNSAGGDGVKICKSATDVEEAYKTIMSTEKNLLGLKSHAVLIQHYVYGKEYVVNMVSFDGEHKLCELWEYSRYERKAGRQIYDTATIVDYKSTEHQDVIDYAIKVLNALNIKYGPAHIEIIKNDDGCYLIELAARLMGANLPFPLLEKCITTSQASYTVTAYSNPKKFKDFFSLPYKILQPLMAIFMVSDQNGFVNEIHHIDEIKALPSFYDMKLAIKSGGKIMETEDYQTSPGMIYLTHKDPNVMELDKQKIREIEKRMFNLRAQKEETRENV